MPTFKLAIERMRNVWRGLPPRGRMAAGAVGVAAFVGLLIWSAWAARGPQFAPLFAQLAPEDAAAIVAKLEAAKVPYRLSAGGTTISVPAGDVYRLRLSMAAQGLPRSGVVGFEIFDKTNLATTDFDRRVDYQRALQGELARTIDQIDGVEASRVHLVLPQDSPFSASASPPSAAVLLRLRPGALLAAGEVRAIQQLVAASVSGLKPDDVTVLDEEGRLLSTGASGGANLELQQQFQWQLQQSLQGLLEQVFGPGSVVTRVQAELNFSHQTVTRDLFTPGPDGQGVLQTVQELKEHFQGQGAPPAMGIPGTSSNVPGSGIPTYPAVGGQGNSAWDREQSTRNYQISQVHEHTSIPPGSVSRLSVAVVVNRNLTAGDQQAVAQLVAAAIGADPARRDQITVLGMPFVAQPAPAPAPAAKGRAPRWAYEAAAAAGVLSLLAFALAWQKRRQAAAAAAEERLAAEVFARTRPAAENGRSDAEWAAVRSRKPEELANVVRAWLAGE